MIESEGNGETGVAQTPFFVEKGQAYHSSLWVRGHAPEGLIVRLKNGDKKIDEILENVVHYK